MELKGSAKSNRIRSSLKSKKLIAPKVEVITENVFVPITRTIFTKKRGDAMQCNFSVPKVDFVKLYQCNNGATMPLLKKPYSLLTNIVSKHKEVETSGKRLRSINRSYSFVNIKKVNFSQQPEIKKQQILIFPSSISNLPLTSFKSYSPAMDENAIKTSKRKKMDKINEKTRIGGINRISSNLPKTNGNDKKLKLHESENVIRRSQNDTTRTKYLSSSSKEKIHLMENNINNSIMSRNTSNVSITLSSTNPTATTKREDVKKQCIFDPYCESVLENIDVAIRGTISNNIIDCGKELKYPITHIESEAFNQLQCSMFDVSTSDNFLKMNGPDTIETMHSKMLATRNFRHHSRENIGHSILSFLRNNRSQYQDSTNSHYGHMCKIKYSWQVIGTSSQTSQTLLDNLVKESNLLDDESVYKCSVKYSWQIIGIATQTSQRDFTVSECRSAISFLSARTNTICHPIKEMICDSPPTATVWRKGKRFIILNNQYTQTFTHKECQTVFTELYKKYQN
ncbi:uncharacterized protein LOC117165091 [Bombus vancouverensis nearcticus]|uniref:uncharacterized protein LOC117165091 n=1 Tax=Bombus vancouverensis nearcticus TaxID=2705178 RepID=UPI00402B7FA7